VANLLRKEFVANRRKELSLTQKQLADAAGISVRTVQCFESNQEAYNPRGRTWTRFGKALKVSLDDLINCL
jgi:transcriptional regulator with XRE-family HTH domain